MFSELELTCGSLPEPGMETILCGINNQVMSTVCSFDGGPGESCSFPLVLEFGRFGSDEHTVVVNVTDVFGQSETVTFTFQLTERKYMYCKPDMLATKMCIYIFAAHKYSDQLSKEQ